MADPAKSRDTSRHGLRYDADELLDSATATFASLGYSAASMDAVAAQIGTTKPTLYSHFGSKDELYEACLSRELGLLQEHLFAAYEAAAQLSTQEQIRNAYAAFFDFAEAKPHGFRLIFAQGQPAFAAQQVDGLVAAVVDRQVRYVTRGLPDGRLSPDETHLLASMLVGIAIQGARELVHGSIDSARAIEIATAVAWAGFPSLEVG